MKKIFVLLIGIVTTFTTLFSQEFVYDKAIVFLDKEYAGILNTENKFIFDLEKRLIIQQEKGEKLVVFKIVSSGDFDTHLTFLVADFDGNIFKMDVYSDKMYLYFSQNNYAILIKE